MIPKFRAWDKEDRDIKEVTGIDWSLDIVELWNGAIERDFDGVCIMASTGLKDKNGVEIFEGDIVKLSVNNGFDYLEDEVCDVRQSRFHSGLVCNNPDNDMEYRIFNQDVLGDYQYEVVGNVWENAELLEVAE